MNRINWLINRVRLMSLSEVMFRVRRSLAQRWERSRVATNWKPLPNEQVTPRYSLFGDDSELLDKWGEKFQLNNACLENYLVGYINFFGHESLHVGNPVVWHRDPVTGTEAPEIFGKDLNYRDDFIVGNVKFTWELGRHQHLVPLAVAYVVSGDVRFRQAVIEQIEGWIIQNPFCMGIHWCSSLESSLRLISWAVVHSLFVLRDGESGLFGIVKDSQRLGESIFQQAYFVRHFLSRYSSANNHLIGELTGLWVACQVFDLGQKGHEWIQFAQKELEMESRRQVHTDGVDKEQAFYYQLWVLEYLFFAWLVSTHSGQSFSDEYVKRILAMANFLEDVSPEGGEPPQVGDADDGFVARFETNWPDKPYRELLDAIKCCFSDSEVAGNQKAFWYRAMAADLSGAYPSREQSRAYPTLYPQGGYVIMGGAGCHIVFDAGPLGYLGIAAHGHADALSFCLAVDGEWWLVDPGTYAYHSNPEWRSYFRGTSAHNTIRINQEDQSQIGGPFMWLEKANAWVDDFINDGDNQCVRGHHDGYKQIGVIHSREIRFLTADRKLEITDNLAVDGGKTELAEIYYHFARDVDIEPGSIENSWVATRKSQKKRLVIYTDPSWKFELNRAITDPISGWYSPALEEKVPACTLYGKAELSSSLSCETRIDIQ